MKNLKVRLGLPVGEKDREEILKHKVRNALVILWGFFLFSMFAVGCFVTAYKIYSLIFR